MPHHPVFGINRALISMPYAVTSIERRAFSDAAAATGARQVLLTAEPVAAAVGSRLPVLGARGTMVVDCGKGIVEAVVLASGALVANASARLNGRTTEDRLQRYVHDVLGLELSHADAGALNISLSTPSDEIEVMVRGRWVASGFPGRTHVRRDALLEVIDDAITDVKACVIAAIELTPPELVTDICNEGIHVSGGGAMTRRLADRLAAELGVDVHLVRAPLSAVATGNAEILFNKDLVGHFAAAV
jgi:rod shape-determining protein MreB